MGSWGKTGDLENFRDKLLTGMTKNGHPLEFAERLYEQMKGFGAYGFPESHAASFALLVYISAYLKCHYPAAFYCSILNSLPMGFYSPSQLMQDARRHDVEVRPIDVRYSRWEHTLETSKQNPPALRLGFCLVSGLQKSAMEQLLEARKLQKFNSALDIRRRAKLEPAQLELLIGAGALQALSGHRHQSHWEAAGIEAFAPLPIDPLDLSEGTELAAPTEIQDMTSDYNHTGLTLGRHPMILLREHFKIFRQCKKQNELGELGHGRFVRVAGIVTGRQRPGTESGVVFLTIEDETGNINVVVWKDLQVRCRDALLTAKLLMVKGVVETDNNVIHVIGGELIDCSQYLNDMALRSRDFH
jgi:error-prone DNA polymerase